MSVICIYFINKVRSCINKNEEKSDYCNVFSLRTLICFYGTHKSACANELTFVCKNILYLVYMCVKER